MIQQNINNEINNIVTIHNDSNDTKAIKTNTRAKHSKQTNDNTNKHMLIYNTKTNKHGEHQQNKTNKHITTTQTLDKQYIYI